MKFSRTILTLLTSSITFSIFATEAPLEQQREIYQKISQLLTISSSNTTQNIAAQLVAEIKDYPLYPYAEYQLFTANLANLNFADIDTYQKQHSNFPLSKNLSKQWLEAQQKAEHWQTILDSKQQLPTNTYTQCAIQQAELAINGKNMQMILPKSAVNLEKNLVNQPQFIVGTLTESQLEQLWLTGNSLPKVCDPLFEQWYQMGGLSNSLIQQRALLAFEQNNVGLLTHLSSMTQESTLQTWLKDLADLRRYAQKISSPDFSLNADNLEINEQNKRILLAIFPSFIKTIKDTDVMDIKSLLSKVDNWAIAFNLTPEETHNWQTLIINQLFDSPNISVQQWRDTVLKTVKEDKLIERRIRMAIREKEDITPWLALLSDEKKAMDEWQYWLTKTSQFSAEKSKNILKSISSQRGFYAMLAAQELGIPYQIKVQETKEIETTSSQQETSHSNLQSPSSTQKVTDLTSVADKYANELARIEELRYFNDHNNMNTEWRELFNQANFNEQIALIKFAEKHCWYDLQVEGTIQAKAWNYLKLRLPNAYEKWFDLFLKDKKITRTFAMAIARQESAWKPYVSSSANAQGLMQLLPSTAKLTAQRNNLPYNQENQLLDPFNNIMLGTTHLQELYDKYGDNRILIAAAYNAGANRVDQWLAKSNGKLTMAEFVASIPFYETRGYVQNVLAYDTYYQILQNKPQQIFSKEEYNKLY
ncbi:transglycosylase SLT domain-containing protein [Mannheimia massilioguelmaensis]|uniref:transglycosylase SLT domain-containing protein n=1 Tax=Mannheimia massilioguelmaensis TaxID=1604354 RepID=UPI0005C9A799|nr:transglycosylase SLT domain-containing protein [Mannheimia massilioguelmaensis]